MEPVKYPIKELNLKKINLGKLKGEISLATGVPLDRVGLSYAGDQEVFVTVGDKRGARDERTDIVPAHFQLSLPELKDFDGVEAVLRAHDPELDDHEVVAERKAQEEAEKFNNSPAVQEMRGEIETLKALVAELMKGKS